MCVICLCATSKCSLCASSKCNLCASLLQPDCDAGAVTVLEGLCVPTLASGPQQAVTLLQFACTAHGRLLLITIMFPIGVFMRSNTGPRVLERLQLCGNRCLQGSHNEKSDFSFLGMCLQALRCREARTCFFQRLHKNEHTLFCSLIEHVRRSRTVDCSFNDHVTSLGVTVSSCRTCGRGISQTVDSCNVKVQKRQIIFAPGTL